MAHQRHQRRGKLLNHTDPGSPDASENDQSVLDVTGRVCRISRVGHRQDNAVVESCGKPFTAAAGENFDGASDVINGEFDSIEIFFPPFRRHLTRGNPKAGRAPRGWGHPARSAENLCSESGRLHCAPCPLG